MTNTVDIVVSGHLCLDLLPRMEHVPLEGLAKPGRLYEVGALDISTGGAVSNTGLALHKLGVSVRLMATVGDDLLGRVIVGILAAREPSLAEHIEVQQGQSSSYTIVLSPEKVDRIFLHSPSTNTDFGADNINFELMRDARLFHFGYPPILPRVIANDGDELEKIYRLARETGVITSLDTSLPDPKGLSGQANWHTILTRTLPYVDIFMPSIEEILFMLRREDYEAWRGALGAHLTADYLHTLAAELLAMGPAIVGFKLGEMGLYIRTGKAAKIERLRQRLPIGLEAWTDKRVWSPAFYVSVVGTTGAGDPAFAGLLSSLLKGLKPQEAVKWACAVGACNVESADAVSGVRTWADTEARMRAGWPARSEHISGLKQEMSL
ncbi:MAG: carbohydrate kinase family protein [Burkholderiales bacterium]|nr:carbohydrate kinase family protein [Anaerolineae bacterium]